MVIAIDGPAGAGKSSVARAAAERLGYTYLDTGAMYRAVAYWATTNDRDPAEVARRSQVDVGERVVLDGHDVTQQIREPWVSDAASRVSADPAVREALVAQQQRILCTGDWVAEGRDIGTVVAPDAAVKVFLTADPRERARRRAAEQGTDAATVLADLTERDARDSGRAHAPLVPANDAVPVDSTGLSLEEVVDHILTLVVEAREIEAEAP
jgi:cytidylate kinase